MQRKYSKYIRYNEILFLAIPVLLLCLVLNSTPGKCSRIKRGSGGRGITLTPSVILDIVNKHNTLRASVSSSDMRRVTWDAELSAVAQDYGTKCQFSHNTEGSHSQFGTSIGENIYVSTGSYQKFDSERAIQLWFNEKSDFTYSTRTCVPGKKCGHYTQVVWADTYKLGCSLTTCDDVTGFSGSASHLFICNYSPAGNVYTIQSDGSRAMLSPFKQGPACTSCKNTSDICIGNLCANNYRDRDELQLNPNKESSCGGLVAAVVILSLALSALLFYTFFGKHFYKRWRNNNNQANHSKFSNHNTPQPSQSTTPRPSIVITNLHGSSGNREGGRRNSKPNKLERPKSRDVQRLYEPKNHNPPSSPSRPLRPPPPQ